MKLESDRRRIPLLVVGLLLLLILSACVEEGAPETATTDGASPTSQPIPTATAPVPTATSIPDATPTAIPEPTPVLPTPEPGWVWHYDEGGGFAVTHPEAWRPMHQALTRTDEVGFQAPDPTNSQIRVSVHRIPDDVDWLDWARENQEEIILAPPVVPEMVEANAAVQGRPAYFRLTEGSGSSNFHLVFPDGNRVIRFYFHSGVLPRSEEEMAVFRAMIENVFLPGEPAGETSLPAGWEQGHRLTRYTDELLFSGPVAPPLRELSGIVEKWDEGGEDFVLAADDGQPYTLQGMRDYYFGGLPAARMRFIAPAAELIREGVRIRVLHYGLTPPGVIQPEFVAVEQDGAWQPAYYKSFFDLAREPFDPAVTALYPQDAAVRLWLRGPLSEVAPFLVDEAGQSLTPESLSIDPSEQVLATGTATTAGGSPRLTLEELFVFDGPCIPLVGSGEECAYRPAP